MREIRLYGHLGKKFGRVHKMDVKSPAEALRALRANFPDFESYMYKYKDHGFQVRVGKECVDEQGLSIESEKAPIRFTPVVKGSGAAGRIILGIVLVVAGAYLRNPYLISMGVSLIVGGVVQMLLAPPKSRNTDEEKNKPSYSFNGPVNTVAQGNIVPVCYGQLLVGSQVVSAGLSVEQVFVPKSSGYGAGAAPEVIKRLYKKAPWDEELTQ